MIDLVITVVACVANISLGTLVILRNARLRASQAFFAATIAISGWSLTTYLSDNASANFIGITTRLSYSTAFLAIAILSYFSFVFPPRRGHQRRLLLGYVVALIIGSVLSASDSVVGSVTLQGNVSAVSTGTFYWEYLACLIVIFGLTIFNLVRNYRAKSLPNHTHNQLLLILSGIGISFVAAVITNGILPVVISNWNYARVGPFLSVILVSTVTLAIVREKLFDIKIVLARSLTYVLLLVTLSVLYIGSAFSLSRFFFSGSGRSTGQTLVYAILSLILAFTFQPLRRVFERLTDRIFFRDRYNAREVLDSISRILVSELQLDRLMSRSLDTLCREMRLQFGQLIIFNDDKVYRIEHFGPLPTRLMIVPELRQLGSGLVVSDDLTGGERKELLDNHGVRVSLGLKSGDKFVGYLLLGDKLSGDTYSKPDLGLLAIIGKELAVGISNAKAYAEIQAFNLTLQDRVNHATSRLRVANRHLKELDKTKDEFLSMASHQLRTPLTTIKGYLSMITEGDAGKLTAAQREFVGYAFDASERMVNLISDLLNVSRLEAGRFLIQTQPCDLTAIVADEVRQLQQHAVNKGLQLVFVPPASKIPDVPLDDNKTRQVIMNFIDNAIYYTKTGSVTVSLMRVGDNVRLEVSDTGIGVPEAAKKKLFSKFYRAENAQGVRPDGTGLGLYLARTVVADQGGTIIFKSSEGHGSTFGFELPLKPVMAKKAGV